MNKINYIVSGLERSGTSMMMQILEKSGFPISYDKLRKPDNNNPNGYYELMGGKIINYLMEETFDFTPFIGKAIKITSFGLRYLPKGNYKILYMQRDINEIIKSQNIMIGKEELDTAMKLTISLANDMILTNIKNRDDIEFIEVFHRNLIDNPEEEIQRISNFLEFDVSKGIGVIDKNLYRNRY